MPVNEDQVPLLEASLGDVLRDALSMDGGPPTKRLPGRGDER